MTERAPPQVSEFRQFAPSVAAGVVVGPFAGSLSSVLDSITLEAPNGDAVAKLRYKNGFPWPAPLSGVHSIQLVDARVRARASSLVRGLIRAAA